MSTNFTLKSTQNEEEWAPFQRQTFCAWVNSHLQSRRLHIKSLETDFDDGARLLHLMEILSGKQSPLKINTKDKEKMTTFEKLQNNMMALEFLQREDIVVNGITPQDLVNCNKKMVLNLIWNLILHYQVQQSLFSGKQRVSIAAVKKALSMWVQKMIKDVPAPTMDIRNFNSNFQDGIILCCLVNALEPDLIALEELRQENKIANVTRAMDIAHQRFNIPKLFVPATFCATTPDELSVITYVSYFLNIFSRSHCCVCGLSLLPEQSRQSVDKGIKVCHPSCYKCADCEISLENVNCTANIDGLLYCDTHAKKIKELIHTNSWRDTAESRVTKSQPTDNSTRVSRSGNSDVSKGRKVLRTTESPEVEFAETKPSAFQNGSSVAKLALEQRRQSKGKEKESSLKGNEDLQKRNNNDTTGRRTRSSDEREDNRSKRHTSKRSTDSESNQSRKPKTASAETGRRHDDDSAKDSGKGSSDHKKQESKDKGIKPAEQSLDMDEKEEEKQIAGITPNAAQPIILSEAIKQAEKSEDIVNVNANHDHLGQSELIAASTDREIDCDHQKYQPSETTSAHKIETSNLAPAEVDVAEVKHNGDELPSETEAPKSDGIIQPDDKDYSEQPVDSIPIPSPGTLTPNIMSPKSDLSEDKPRQSKDIRKSNKKDVSQGSEHTSADEPTETESSWATEDDERVDLLKCRAEGTGLSKALHGKSAQFVIYACNSDGEALSLPEEESFKIRIASSGGSDMSEKMDIHIEEQGEGLYMATFTAHVSCGEYSISIRKANKHIPGSPFTLAVSEENEKPQIRVHGIEELKGEAGQQISSAVKLSGYSPVLGDVTITAESPDGGPVGITITPKHDDVFVVSYLPATPGTYQLAIFLAGKPVPDSPFRVTCMASAEKANKGCCIVC